MHPDRSATHSFDPRLGQGLHSFLHGGHGSADKTPKVLLLLEGKEAELPDWYALTLALALALALASRS